MKIEFHILWVDDNKDYVNSLKPQIEKLVENHGLVLSVHWYPSEDGIFLGLEKNKIDLIVLDLNLKGQKKGDVIISDIRSREIYEDIVFYSTGTIPNDRFGIPPDGVFFVEREDLKTRIGNLINLKIRRISDVATLRGWIVADAIELELILGGVLAKCFKGVEILFRERVLHEDMLDFGKKCSVLNGIIKDEIQRSKNENIDKEKIQKLEFCKGILSRFSEEIIEVRNAVAHQMAEVADTGHMKIKMKTKKKDEIVLTSEKCVEIRKNIIKHFKNLLDLDSLL